MSDFRKEFHFFSRPVLLIILVVAIVGIALVSVIAKQMGWWR